MPDINGIPYVESTDLVSAYPAASQALAQEVSDQLASKPAKTSAMTAPTSPATGDIWYDTNSTPPTAKFWDGSAWQPFSSGTPAAVISSPAATGNYTDGNGIEWDYWTITSTTTVVVDTEGEADLLVVGSGGGGQAATFSAGGGGGGVRFGTFILPAASHTATVGAGGASATNGNDSSFGTILKCGGGQRGHSVASPTNFGKITPGGGGSPGGTTIGSYGNAAGSGAGGATYATNHYDPISIDYTGAATDYAKGGQTGTTGAANTGNGGYGSNAGGSGVIVIRVKV